MVSSLLHVIVNISVLLESSHRIFKLWLLLLKVMLQSGSQQSCPIHTNWNGSKLQVYDPYRLADRKRQFSVRIQSENCTSLVAHITCYSSEGETAVCRSVRFVRIVSAIFGPYTIGKLHLPQQANQTCMYTSFFKCEWQCDPFGAKAWATIAKAWATTNKPNMYTSFFKRERQYDPFGAQEIINRQDTATTNKPNMHTSFLSVSDNIHDNMTRLERRRERQ